MSRWSRPVALLGLCVVLRVVSLARPCLSDDEATYCVVAREMLTGHALYRDVVDHKPPAIYFVYEITQAIGGPTGGMVLLHALLIVVVWATGLVLAGIARRVDPRAGPYAAVLWLVFTTTHVDVDSLAANCELFMMLPIALSVAVVLAAEGRPLWLAGAGALVGVAMLFKYQAGIQLPLYAIAWVVAQRASPGRAIVGLVALGVGVAVPIAGAIAGFAAAGSLAAAKFWFLFNFSYIDAGSSPAEMVGRAAVRGGFAIGSALLLYVLAARGALERRDRFAIGWVLASLLAVLAGGRFFGHYFHQLTAPLAVLAAPVAARLDRRWLVAGMAIPAAIFLGLGALHEQMMRWAGEPDPDYASVVTWLDAHAAPSDAICIWGNSPVLYFEAERPLGCRFVFANYLTGLSPATTTQSDPRVDSSRNVVPAAWDMLDADLAARRPRFIVDGSPGDVAFYGKYPPDKFPRLARVLRCDYAAAADVAGMRIYRRLPVPTCESSARSRAE